MEDKSVPVENWQPDSIVQTIVQRFLNRAKFGESKYNTNLDRTDFSPQMWAEYAIEELHDGMLYLEKWKQEQGKNEKLLALMMKVFGDANINGLSYEQTIELHELKRWYKEHTTV